MELLCNEIVGLENYSSATVKQSPGHPTEYSDIYKRVMLTVGVSIVVFSPLDHEYISGTVSQIQGETVYIVN